MDTKHLEALGLTVRQTEGLLEADLDLTSGQLLNPLTRKFLNRASFTVVGDRLLAIDPPELVGCPPVVLGHVTKAQDIESQLVQALNEHIFQLQRRSAELTAIGVSPQVDPESLQLSAEVVAGHFRFVIAADKQGNFRVARAVRGDVELTTSTMQAFELSEFRERSALEGYLAALFGELLPTPEEQQAAVAAMNAPAPTPGPVSPAVVTFGDIVRYFSEASVLPPKSPLELVVELRVGAVPYRFAAARVAGRTFRGLLAGSSGRIWAERFELDAFPGVAALVSKLLSVPIEQVELVGRGGA